MLLGACNRRLSDGQTCECLKYARPQADKEDDNLCRYCSRHSVEACLNPEIVALLQSWISLMTRKSPFFSTRK